MSIPFADAHRVSTSVLTDLERRCLHWLARRLPGRVNSDHLTGLAFAAMILTGCSFAAARYSPASLYLVPLWLAVNWFGDSLDGTLARVRQQQRPRYGFYVDHVLDVAGVLFLLGGLGLSGYMSAWVAAAVLIAYYLLSLEIFLATYCVGTFRMSFWKVGPTELRLGLALGTLAVAHHPTTRAFGTEYLVLDIAGTIAAAALLVTVMTSATRHVRLLYNAEPIPPRSVEHVI